MLLHAAFALLLGRWSHATDLVVGTPVMNRREPALEALVGCFVNTLVLRLDCAGAANFRELLARAREVNQRHLRTSRQAFDETRNP